MGDAIQKFDLEGYIQKYGAVPAQPNEWLLTCPECGKPDKLVVNTLKKSWHCWVCEEYRIGPTGRRVPVRGAGGVLALIEMLESCTRERAVGILMAGQTDYPLYYEEEVEEPGTSLNNTMVQPAPEIPPPPGWCPIDGRFPYCIERGISGEDVRVFGLVYCMTGRYAGRLVFPIWENKVLVYYQARATWKEIDRPGQRYVKALNPPNHPGMAGAGDVLMNLDTAKRYGRVAIVEGPVDCVHAGPSAVATLGKKISVTQILKLRQAGVRAIDLAWDGPTPTEPRGAWPEMMREAPRLQGVFDDVRLVFFPQGDPGSMSRPEIDYHRAHGVPASSISRLAVL